MVSSLRISYLCRTPSPAVNADGEEEAVEPDEVRTRS